VAVGLVLTVTEVDADTLVHPFAPVTVTVYVPVVLTLIACVVADVLHKYELAALEVNVTLPPVQKVVDPLGVTVTVGSGRTVTVVGELVAVPTPATVTVTV